MLIDIYRPISSLLVIFSTYFMFIVFFFIFGIILSNYIIKRFIFFINYLKNFSPRVSNLRIAYKKIYIKRIAFILQYPCLVVVITIRVYIIINSTFPNIARLYALQQYFLLFSCFLLIPSTNNNLPTKISVLIIHCYEYTAPFGRHTFPN